MRSKLLWAALALVAVLGITTAASATTRGFELRHHGEIIATGRLTRDEPLKVDDEIMIAGRASVVRAVEPQLGDRTLHLFLEDSTVS